jgi:simple sugar transport system ATP-binding protein
VNFSLRKGDILGITGLHGSGRDELALSLFGLNPPDSGKIIIDGKPREMTSPWNSVSLGIGLVPEDRLTQALFSTHSVADNITAASLPGLTTNLGVINNKVFVNKSQEMVEKLHIRTPNLDLLVQNLSGGNQQKTVIARWALTSPHVLILNGPTVGVDVASKADIYEIIQNFAAQGMSIILISDEMTELLANCNRILVMRSNKIIGRLSNEEIEQSDAAARIQLMMSGESNETSPNTAVDEVEA